ncbi:MAG: hypothetical protein JNL68_18065 [Burkholderiales bacterium]|nr:hypothetical protein [Burkholderiales bacterium]
MAKLKPIRIDGQPVAVDVQSRLKDILAPDVQSVRTEQGALITRADFARVPIPDGFETNLSAINKGGASKPHRRPVIIDGTFREVTEGTSLGAIVPVDAQSVRTLDGTLITRADFARVPIPEGFETNLSAINKGRAPRAGR